MRARTWQLIFFVLLSLATLWIGTSLDRYRPIASQMLTNADFSQGLLGWTSRPTRNGKITTLDGTVTLFSATGTNTTMLYQGLARPIAARKIRVRASLASRDIVTGKNPWNTARLLFHQYRHGTQMETSHQVARLDGTQGWQEVARVFKIRPDATEFRVSIVISNASGTMWLRDLHLEQVENSPLYRILGGLLGGALFCFVVSLLLPYLHPRHLVFQTLLILFTVALILLGTAMPASVKNRILDVILVTAWDIGHSEQPDTGSRLEATGTIVPSHQAAAPKSALKEIALSKIAHFILFALLGLLLWSNTPQRGLKRILLDILLLACATELNQFFSENRSPLITDFLIDMAGGGTGILLAQGLAWHKEKEQ